MKFSTCRTKDLEIPNLSFVYAKCTERKRTIVSYDHELERTLRNMIENLGINDDYTNQNIPPLVDVHGLL